MQKLSGLFLSAIFLPALISSPLYAQQGGKSVARMLQEEFNGIADRSKPAVVSIQVATEQKFRVMRPEYFYFGVPDSAPVYKQRVEGLGSGVIIDPAGYVLTNAHVVGDADEITVVRVDKDGQPQSYPAKVLGQEPQLDLAVVKIDTKDPLPWLKLGDSSKSRVADWVMAIGSPFGLEQTVTVGVISAVRQTFEIEDRRFRNMIQTDTAINRGNSGGPLINLDGEVIAINTAIFSPSGTSAGVGFAIPTSEILPLLEDMKAGRKVQRGWAGLSVSPVDPVFVRQWNLKTQKGAVVQAVVKGSPAHKAGLRRGDVLLKMDGAPVSGPNDIIALVRSRKPGDKMSVELLRAGQKKTATLKLSSAPQDDSIRYITNEGDSAPESAPVSSWQGMNVAQDSTGVVVESFADNSRLKNFLAAGDVIRAVNGAKVSSLEDFGAAIRNANVGEGVVFDIERQGMPMYISVQIK